MAPADVEWVLGVVRAGRDYQGMDHAKAGGAGYEFTATIIVRGRTAEIVGGAGRLTPALAKEIEIALCSHGITTAIWERFNGDPKRLVRATRGRAPRNEAAEQPDTFVGEPGVGSCEADIAHQDPDIRSFEFNGGGSCARDGVGGEGRHVREMPLPQPDVAEMTAASLAGVASLRAYSSGMQSLNGSGFGALRHGLNGLAPDLTGACCQPPAGGRPSELPMRQKVSSR